jgi:RNA polymerase sigma-70 factor (ECF subfamily)
VTAGGAGRVESRGGRCGAIERFAHQDRRVGVAGVERVGVAKAQDPGLGRADDVRARTFAEMLDRRLLDSTYRYATLMLGDRGEAEDVTHDAALTAWRHLEALRDPAKFEAWFGRIVVNACRDRLRARRRMPVLLELELDASGPDVNEGLAGRDVMARAIRSLSPDHREVVVLRFYADLTIDQIAARTGQGAGTVKSRLHYALRHLRAAVDADGEGRSWP